MIKIKENNLDVDLELQKKVIEIRKKIWKNKPGYMDLPYRSEILEESISMGQSIKSKYSHMVVVGMGGSSLGAQALIEALSSENSVSFLSDSDPEYLDHLLKKIDLEKTHWLIVSKSGETLEVLALINIISEFLSERNYDLSKKSTVITEPKPSSIRDWASLESIPIVDHPLDVGGRFSVLSPVGLLPCSFAGLKIDKLIKGALWTQENSKIVEDFCLQILQSFKREEFISVFWFYSMGFEKFGLWLNQLWAESLAKTKTLNFEKAPRVSTPYTCIGARDQHSVLQQLAEGYKDKFICFFQLLEFDIENPDLCKNLFLQKSYLANSSLQKIYKTQSKSTYEALEKQGVSQMYFEIAKSSEDVFGALIMLFESSIGVLGGCLNINPYDQPGVEAGKVLTVEKLLHS